MIKLRIHAVPVLALHIVHEFPCNPFVLVMTAVRISMFGTAQRFIPYTVVREGSPDRRLCTSKYYADENPSADLTIVKCCNYFKSLEKHFPWGCTATWQWKKLDSHPVARNSKAKFQVLFEWVHNDMRTRTWTFKKAVVFLCWAYKGAGAVRPSYSSRRREGALKQQLRLSWYTYNGSSRSTWTLDRKWVCSCAHVRRRRRVHSAATRFFVWLVSRLRKVSSCQ